MLPPAGYEGSDSPSLLTLVILCLLIVIVLIGVKCYLTVVLFGFLKFLLIKAVVFHYTGKQSVFSRKAGMSNSITLKLTSMLYHIPPY